MRPYLIQLDWVQFGPGPIWHADRVFGSAELSGPQEALAHGVETLTPWLTPLCRLARWPLFGDTWSNNYGTRPSEIQLQHSKTIHNTQGLINFFFPKLSTTCHGSFSGDNFGGLSWIWFNSYIITGGRIWESQKTVSEVWCDHLSPFVHRILPEVDFHNFLPSNPKRCLTCSPFKVKMHHLMSTKYWFFFFFWCKAWVKSSSCEKEQMNEKQLWTWTSHNGCKAPQTHTYIHTHS